MLQSCFASNVTIIRAIALTSSRVINVKKAVQRLRLRQTARRLWFSRLLKRELKAALVESLANTGPAPVALSYTLKTRGENETVNGKWKLAAVRCHNCDMVYTLYAQDF